MNVGNPDRFAIEAEIEERVGEWVLGHFRFWICGHAVGDWDDSADLLGCLRWLKEFSEQPRDRYEPRLCALPPKEVFRRVFDPVMSSTQSDTAPLVEDAYARFHISYLGMSSFERFDLLLLTDEHGAQRCLWRESKSDDMHECFLWRMEMERIAGEFCKRFEQVLTSHA